MTTEFADYVAQQDAKNTIQLNVRKWTLMLCDALEHNFTEYKIRSYKRSANLADRVEEKAYYASKIEEAKKECAVSFTIDEGRKYMKIVFNDSGNSRSVHAFVDKKTGEVYKPASFKAPAKIVRFDLRSMEQREWVLQNCDWSGGYLYLK
jgi:outer membrane protein assembly factor BamA